MKRIVLTFGLIAGAILSAMMIATLPFMKSDSFDPDIGQVVGYSTMVLAFLMIYFGIRSYRDNVGGGTITFGRAVGVGLLITLVAALLYVATWQILYNFFIPDFADHYAACVIRDMREDGASVAEIEKMRRQMVQMKEWMDNPLINASLTLLEPLPVGLVMTFVCAGILRRKTPAAPAWSAARVVA